MPRNRERIPALSDAQREIMEIIWERGELTASSVREILESRRPIARNTVRTLLERMESKGWLKHREDGRTFHYSAAVPREASVGQRVVELVDQVCGGAPETLMTALLDYRGLSKRELDRIRQMLDAASVPTKKGGGK